MTEEQLTELAARVDGLSDKVHELHSDLELVKTELAHREPFDAMLIRQNTVMSLGRELEEILTPCSDKLGSGVLVQIAKLFEKYSK